MVILLSAISLVGLLGIGYLGYQYLLYNRDNFEFEYQYEIADDGVVKLIFENLDNPNEPYIYEGVYDKWFYKGVAVIDEVQVENLNKIMDQVLELEDSLIDKGEF